MTDRRLELRISVTDTHSLTLADKVTNRKTCAFKINNRRSALTSGLVESSLNLVS